METRYCLQCQKPLTKYRYESRAKYAGKKFCCLEHAHKYLKKNKLGWWADKDKLFALSYEDRQALLALKEFGYMNDENIDQDQDEYQQIQKEIKRHNTMKGSYESNRNMGIR